MPEGLKTLRSLRQSTTAIDLTRHQDEEAQLQAALLASLRMDGESDSVMAEQARQVAVSDASDASDASVTSERFH